MKRKERIELFQKDINELDKHAENAEAAYQATLKSMNILTDSIKVRKKTEEDFQIMTPMLREKFANEIESFRLNNSIIRKFSLEVSNMLDKEIDDLENRHRKIINLHMQYDDDLSKKNVGIELLKLIQFANVESIVVFRMLKFCRLSIKDTISRTKELAKS